MIKLIREFALTLDEKLYFYIDDGDGSWSFTFMKGKGKHRENKPAYEHANGHKEWWLNDKLHRTDGPAIEYANGSKRWFIEGIQFNDEEKYKEELLRQARDGR